MALADSIKKTVDQRWQNSGLTPGKEMAWVYALITTCCHKVNRLDLIPCFRARFNEDYSRRLGNARVVRKRKYDPDITKRIEIYLQLSWPIWPTTSKEERKNTIIHEIAHALASIVYDEGVNHGPGWKRMMGILGAPPDRCHREDRTGLRRRNKTFGFKCPNCPNMIIITSNRRTRWIKQTPGKKGYRRWCPKCNAPIDAPYVQNHSYLASDTKIGV